MPEDNDKFVEGTAGIVEFVSQLTLVVDPNGDLRAEMRTAHGRVHNLIISYQEVRNRVLRDRPDNVENGAYLLWWVAHEMLVRQRQA